MKPVVGGQIYEQHNHKQGPAYVPKPHKISFQQHHFCYAPGGVTTALRPCLHQKPYERLQNDLVLARN